MQSHMNDLLHLQRVRLGHRDGVQWSKILIRQEPAWVYCGHPQIDRYPCRAVCVRRVGEESPNHRQKRERRVRQPDPHRQHQPVPIQGLLLRRRDRLVLSEHQILRPQRRQVPVSRCHPRCQRRLAGVQSLRLLQQQSCYVCRCDRLCFA